MAVLKLQPSCKNYIWGGIRLKEEYGIISDLNPLAESWMLSTHKDGESIIENGEYFGKTLNEYIELEGKSVLGKNAEKFNYFPILIKLIDAKQNLSVQVHPNNDYALKNEGQYGKTEMWYVLDAEPNAVLYCGFNSAVSKNELRDRINNNNTLLDIMNTVKVRKGDKFFIPAGTVHAIGKGIILAEIQQNSSVTYRIYDYNRIAADGKKRELHIDKALDVIDCNRFENSFNFNGHLVSCDYFTTDVVLGNYIGYCDESSFISILIVEGAGELCCNNISYKVKKGDSYFISANSGKYILNGKIKALITSI